MNQHRKDIDLLKGIAIIAVILYHLHVMQYGYLGVDLFFAINGFLLIPRIIEDINSGTFRYLPFLEKRVMRLLPLLLIVSIPLLIIGWWGMLPYDYEKLCEGIVATNLLSNNILAVLTTGSYWTVSNDYKPLMHTWFVGILFEFYVLFPPIMMLLKHQSAHHRWKFRKVATTTVALLTIISLLSFLTPSEHTDAKYYLLPYRLYEITLGGLAGIWLRHRQLPLPVSIKALCLLGTMSYSLYLWHQPLLALYRYFVSSTWTPTTLLLYTATLLLLSATTYLFVEKKATAGKISRITLCTLFIITTVPATVIALRAGVVRDVPELGITTANVSRKIHSQYVDRIYAYDRDFPQHTPRTNVLVIGNSFARDWANILLESEVADTINLSYTYNISKKQIPRIRSARYIFIYGRKHSVPSLLWENLRPGTEVYGIGTKSFGESNGRIYIHRNTPDYYQHTATIQPEHIALNNELKHQWGTHYIDLMSLYTVRGNQATIFTPEKKFISPDTRHLSPYGARYLARRINLTQIFHPLPPKKRLVNLVNR